MNRMFRLGLILTTPFFLWSCKNQEAAVDSSEGEVEVLEHDESNGSGGVQSKPEFELQDCLVGVATLREPKKWDIHVGLGFRLGPDSETSYVIYCGGKLSKSVRVFVDGEFPLWESGKNLWTGKSEGGMRVIAYPSETGKKFPLLSEYQDLIGGAGGARAWMAEDGKDLFTLKEENLEMSRILNEEATDILERIEKYRREYNELKRERTRSSSRLVAAVSTELKKSEKELEDLRIRALRLGIRIKTGRVGDELDKAVRFVLKPLPFKGESDEEDPNSRGVVVAGGVASIQDEKTVAQYSLSEWQEVIRLSLREGRVWLYKYRDDWFIRTRYEWTGFSKQDVSSSFEIWPFVDGRPDEGAPVEVAEDLSLSKFPLSNLAEHESNRFHCRYTVNAENGESFVRSFDFAIKKNSEGKVIPTDLQSEDLTIEVVVPKSSSNPEMATLLKTLPAEGAFINAISYQHGRRLLLQMATPPKIGIVDTEVMDWLKEWKLPNDDCLTTTNGKDLFVYCPQSHSLDRRDLGKFEELQKEMLEQDEEVLAMGIGTEVPGTPLLLVYPSRMELRDPRTLQVLKPNLMKGDGFSSDRNKEATMNIPSDAGQVMVLADPLGEAFSVSYENRRDDRKWLETIVAYQRAGNWFQRKQNSFSVVSRGKRISKGTRFYQAHDDGKSIRQDSFSGSFIHHTEGRGIMGCRVEEGGTFPPAPVKISFLSSVDGEFTPLCFAGGGSSKYFINPHKIREYRIRNFLPIFINPVNGAIVSLGEGKVIFEKIPEGFFSPHQVLEKTPPAWRGEKWEYKPVAHDGSTPEYQIEEGPPGMTYSKDDGFQWPVPLILKDNNVQVKVSGKEHKTTFTIPVVGKTETMMTDVVAGSDGVAVPVLKKVSFEDPISNVVTMHSKDVVIVMSNNSRKMSVIDLATGKILASLDSPRGPMVACSMHDEVLICYLDGMILERRSVSDLKVIKIAQSGGNGELLSLAVSQVEGGGRPFGVFDTGLWTVVVRELDPETLKFESPLPINEFQTHRVKNLPSSWVTKSATSLDGKSIWLGRDLLRQNSPGSYTFFPDVGPFGFRGPFFTDVTGSRFFTSRVVINHATKQSWENPVKNGTMLVPDDRGDWFLGVKVFYDHRSEEANNTIEVYDAVSKKARYRLEGFNEWVGSAEGFSWGTAGFHRVILSGTKPYLVTLSSDERDLVIRKLPIQKN